MDLRIDMEFQGGLLLVTASGNVALDAALRVYKQIFDRAKEERVNKILVNTLAVDGELTTLERYTLAMDLVAYLKEREMNPRLANVGKPPTTNGFAVRVGQNRGVSVEVFSSQQEALSWLAKWPN
jgi:hypothetical protein